MDLSIFTTHELVALARLDLEARRLDLCLEKVKTALALSPTDINVTGLGARVYAQLKLFSTAITLYKQYLEQAPEALTERFQFGMVHLESGKPAEALRIWQQVLEVMPTHPPSLFYSGIASIENNQRDEAVRFLDILLKSAPVDNLYFGRAKELLQQLNSGNLAPAKDPAEVYQ